MRVYVYIYYLYRLTKYYNITSVIFTRQIVVCVDKKKKRKKYIRDFSNLTKRQHKAIRVPSTDVANNTSRTRGTPIEKLIRDSSSFYVIN